MTDENLRLFLQSLETLTLTLRQGTTRFYQLIITNLKKERNG